MQKADIISQKKLKYNNHCKNPGNIRLDEDVLKKFFIFVFRRRVEDVLLKTNVFILPIRLQDVFKRYSRHLAKTSSRHLQDVLKTSSRRLAKMSSRRFQNVSSG